MCISATLSLGLKQETSIESHKQPALPPTESMSWARKKGQRRMTQKTVPSRKPGLAAADSITRAGEEGKLHSTMAEAFGLAPRLRRPALLLNESLRMPGQVVGEVSTIHRVDDLGNPFTMTYPSDSGGMSNKHGEVFYRKAGNRTGALLPGPRQGVLRLVKLE